MLDQLDHRVQATYELPFRRLKEKIGAARVRLGGADPDGDSRRSLVTARLSEPVSGELTAEERSSIAHYKKPEGFESVNADHLEQAPGCPRMSRGFVVSGRW